MESPLVEHVRQVVQAPEQDLDLGRIALLPALVEYPRLDLGRERARLAQIAENFRVQANGAKGSGALLPAMNQYLFDTLKFRGNEEDYFDPRNSFLNDVIDRRTGIPITLSVIYLEVARRVGLRSFGVGLPFHFLVKVEIPGGWLYVDPFHQGEFLEPGDCHRLIEELAAHNVSIQPSDFDAVGARYILKRMLANLKRIYSGRGQWRKLLAVLDALVVLEPQAAMLRRERAVAYCEIRQSSRAIDDFKEYLRLAPHAPDRDMVSRSLGALHKTVAMLN